MTPARLPKRSLRACSRGDSLTGVEESLHLILRHQLCPGWARSALSKTHHHFRDPFAHLLQKPLLLLSCSILPLLFGDQLHLLLLLLILKTLHQEGLSLLLLLREQADNVAAVCSRVSHLPCTPLWPGVPLQSLLTVHPFLRLLPLHSHQTNSLTGPSGQALIPFLFSQYSKPKLKTTTQQLPAGIEFCP